MIIVKIFKAIAKLLLFLFYLLEKFLIFLALLIKNFIQEVKNTFKKTRSNSTFQLVPISQISGFTKIIEKNGGVENIYLPRIVGLSNGGFLSVNMPSDYLCTLNNVSFVPYSDFIRDVNGKVSNEKLYRKEYDVLIPRDRDIFEIKGQSIRLFNKKNKVYSKVAFSLLGTISYHWAHFLAQYYPKLMFLENFPKVEEIDLIILKNTDLHIKFLIEHEIKKYPNVHILEIDEESEIICKKLYHVSLGTLVADDGYLPTPFAILISKSTLQFWKAKALELVPKESIQFRKIYLGRSGGRSLKNNDEVREFFVSKGFEEVFPHLLSIGDKIKIFSEAKYIVGPGSSAFANNMYSKPGTKILAFMNSFRYLDTYIPEFSNYVGHDFWFMTGKDENIKEMNSSYEISLQDIKKFMDDNNFLDY
jgi:hypothetical protein